jgi:hypothetical protein
MKSNWKTFNLLDFNRNVTIMMLPNQLRPIGKGNQELEKRRSKRINLEGNTHAQEINASQLPI